MFARADAGIVLKSQVGGSYIRKGLVLGHTPARGFRLLGPGCTKDFPNDGRAHGPTRISIIHRSFLIHMYMSEHRIELN